MDLSQFYPFAFHFQEKRTSTPSNPSSEDGYTTFETKNDGIEEADVDQDKKRAAL